MNISPHIEAAAASTRSESEVRQQRISLSMVDVINAAAVCAPAKVCPFCGTHPGLAVMRAGKYLVGCDAEECEANPQVWRATLPEAWAAWNRRA